MNLAIGGKICNAREGDTILQRGMAWTAFRLRDGYADRTTNAVYDHDTKTAEHKACAINVEGL
jgi:hypothetical protein